MFRNFENLLPFDNPQSSSNEKSFYDFRDILEDTNPVPSTSSYRLAIVNMYARKLDESTFYRVWFKSCNFRAFIILAKKGNISSIIQTRI
ncbi:14542_t:CDS:2, partial [Gigaspora rosea]